MENIALQSLQIFYIIVLRAEIATTFGSKMVEISTRNTKIWKICELRKYIFPYFTTFRDQILVFTAFVRLFLGISICCLDLPTQIKN